MSDLHEPDARLATSPGRPGTTDRRRPGRPQSVSPALLPLLRAPHGITDPLSSVASTSADAAIVVPPALGSGEDGDSRPFRGIIVTILLSSPFWAAALHFVLR